MSTPAFNIRNFCIIAHIDHGKSTLADRFLELTHTVSQRDMKEQVLDQMELEREKGITIKLTPVRMKYIPLSLSNSSLNYQASGKEYILNLIDTPGHVDFTYEVSRSLAAVEGAILLVDATKGIQAQTLSNLYLALEQDLAIILVVNKIDLPNADVAKTKKEMASLLGVDELEILEVSAKKGTGVEKVLERVVRDVPAPISPASFRAISSSKRAGEQPSARGSTGALDPVRALIFDSQFDEYKGVLAYVRVFDGQMRAGDKVKFAATGKESEVLEVGVFTPKLKKTEQLEAGEIGYVVTGLKQVEVCRVGDTIVGTGVNPLPGYKEVKPMVFAGIHCKEGSDFNKLREALQKLKLTDAALNFEPENSPALGFGFRCGFLGLLHLEIIQERLRREYELELVVTTPSVAYKINLKNGKQVVIHSPQELPNPNDYETVSEPWMKIDIITPEDYFGNVMKLLQDRSGVYKTTEYLTHGQSEGAVPRTEAQGGYGARVILHYEIPLSFLLTDFYDKLKSATSGYASMNYEFLEYRLAELEKIDILVAEEKIEALSAIVYKKRAYQEARAIVKKLKEAIPRQMFEVKIQAAVGYQEARGNEGGGKIIASERISAMRKDVTAKLYGGDVTRKRKLLEKQKKGKKKMKSHGRVDIPTEAYLAVLKR
ncbi:translation elongation factor 4 [Patescibacteria group bacterium]|nr:translation elongation factor 4 [Patescibacteria group bacterium]MBU4512988.1 translation elongation factor 4 [Patescibacteria group bacterium]MCG2693025.1 translation elongation factor 4 [Candidatus Parcubacteria bacterium]